MYLCHTQPDIIFSVYKLVQFLVCPDPIHKSALQRIFKYIKYIISFGIQYREKQIYLDLDYFTVDHNIIGNARIFTKKGMQAFANVDYISDLINRKSIHRYLFIISRDIVYLSNTKQKLVASYIIEAEYIVLSLSSRQVIQICCLVSSIEGTLINLAILFLFGNNKASL